MKKLLIFAVLFISTSFLYAQSNDEGLAFLQLNFFNPGARSLAMGGAFVGMADDATAAVANPSGLTYLNRPEFSVEFSSTSYRNEIPWHSGLQIEDRDDAANSITFTNFRNTFVPQDFSNRVSDLSFASFVYPLIKNRFVLSGFYNRQTKFERDFSTDGFRIDVDRLNGGPCNNPQICGPRFFFPTDNSLNLTIKNFGASFAYKSSEELSVGVTINTANLDVESVTNRFNINNRSQLINTETLSGSDTKVTVAFGALFKPIRQWSIGAVYTNRPKFDVESSVAAFNANGTPNPAFQNTAPQKLQIPDSFGFGVSYRPNDMLAINFDIARILYSQLNEGYYNSFFTPAAASINPSNNDPDFGRDTHEIPDGTEYRVGGEYLISIGSYPFALRAGYWREPFHSIVSTVSDAQLVQQLAVVSGTVIAGNQADPSPFFSRSLIKNYNHVSFGTGLVLTHFTIDWAYDYSKNFKQFIISTDFYL